MSKALFVTGTGTDVGKTYITGLILKKFRENGMNAAYFKAAMSGNERDRSSALIPGDALWAKKCSGISQSLESMCSYVYEKAVSPHLAAKLEGNPIEMENVLNGFDLLCGQYDYVTVEGIGGIVCPLRFDMQRIGLEDFILARNLNCLIVADAGLGTINATVLTVEYMKNRGIRTKGIVLNRYEPENSLHEDNAFMCEELTGLRILACVYDKACELDMTLDVLEALYS